MSEELFKKLTETVDLQVERMNKLTAGTPYGTIEAVPDHNIFEDIIKECKDSDFWTNFKEISPVLLCFATEVDPTVCRERDLCVTGEILKTKSLLEAIKKKLEDNDSKDLDITDISVAVKILSDKVDVINYLKEPDSDPTELRFDLKGTSKKVKVNIKKLQEAIQFVEAGDSETPAPPKEEEKKVELTEEEDAYIEDKLSKFDLSTDTRGIIDKKCMMELMKIIGDFSKFRSKDISRDAQDKRLSHYDTDSEKYIDTILETMGKEEQSFNLCTKAVLEKKCITPEIYAQSEQVLIMDPASQMELLQKGIESEDANTEVPEELTKEETIKLLKESNDQSFKDYSKYKDAVQKKDPYLTPVVIS